MKKFLLSGTVVLAFIIYSFYDHATGAMPTLTIEPKHTQKIQITTTPVATPSTTPRDSLTDKPTSTPEQTTPTATPTPQPTNKSGLKDGTYTGSPADAIYGTIQVE